MNSTPLMPEPEFSSPLSIEKIPAGGMIKSIDVDPAARQKLIARFDLLDLTRLHADLTIKVVRAGQAIQVNGDITADVVQRCGVTNEPVPDHIETNLDVMFTSDPDEKVDGTQFVEPEDAEIEVLVGGVIDLGELVVQNFGVALNPYPRKPDAVFEGVIQAPQSNQANQLALLGELTKKSKDKSNT